MKLLGSTKNKKATDKNNENVPHLEITKVALVHCDIWQINDNNNNYWRINVNSKKDAYLSKKGNKLLIN